MVAGSGSISAWAWIALVAAWLVCGAVAAVAAWFAQPHRSCGRMIAGATGLSGAFLGGEAVMMVVGHPGLSIVGAAVGAAVGVVGLSDLQERHPELDRRPRKQSLSRLWSWVSLLWPVLLAALIGTILSLIADSAVLGTLIALATMLVIYQGRRSARITRR
jgi:hypothetical protein